MFDHRIIPIDERRDTVLAPDEMARVPLLWCWQHEAQARIVAFALDTVKSTPFTFKANFVGLTMADAIGGLLGTGFQGLSHCRVNVVGNPGTVEFFGSS